VKTTTELLKPADIAPLLGVTRRRVYQLIEARVIPAVRIGGAVRIPRASWLEWVRLVNERATDSVRSSSPRVRPHSNGQVGHNVRRSIPGEGGACAARQRGANEI